MPNREKTTKQVRITSRYMKYDEGRIIVIDNKSADALVADGDAEYCHEYDKPVEKKKPGRPKKVIEVAAVQPGTTPEGKTLKHFSGKPGRGK